MKKDGIQTRNRKISAKLKKMAQKPELTPVNPLAPGNPHGALLPMVPNAEAIRLFGYQNVPPMAHAAHSYTPYQFQHPIHHLAA